MMMLGPRALLLSSLTLGVIAGCSSGRDQPAPFPEGAGATTPGTSSNDEDPSLSTPDEQAELAALEIGSDEPIVDEGDVATADATDPLPANPLDTDPDGAIDTDVVDDGTAADLATASFHVDLSPMGLPNAPVGSTTGLANSWSCVTHINGTDRHDTIGHCVCAGSPLNCEVPNTQPGKNRYLRPTWDSDLTSEGVPQADHGTFVDDSSWDVNAETVLYEGGGSPRGNMHGICYVANPTKNAAKPFVSDPSHSCAKINYGQIKSMAVNGLPNQKFVYAFSVRVGGAGDENSTSASGWIPFSSVAPSVSALLDKMPAAAPARPKSLTFAKTHYVVRTDADYPTTANAMAFEESKVGNNPNAQEGSNKKVGDYLEHDGVINVAFGTPGVGGPATETRFVGDHTLLFRRALSSKYPTLVYSKTSVANGSDGGRHRLIFAFGEIGGRFGWLATPAFMKGERATPPDPCAQVPGDKAACDSPLGYTGFACSGGHLTKRFTCPTATPNCQGGAADGQSITCANAAP